jgi:hypothetical protein
MTKLILLSALCLVPQTALPHGYAGNRYFPPTIEVDDPFAANEVHAIAGRRPKESAPSPTRSSAYTVGGGIEPVDGFGISLDATYRQPNENISPARNGFDNLELTVKKELVINAEHEYAITAGVASKLGGTGANGTTSHSTYTPMLFYAKGFGDLPDSLRLLRPFALTGVIGRETPMDALRPAMLNWSFTIQYSLLYLESYVKDIGLREPFNRLIPVVEFPVRTCLSHECSGKTTGTMNPGLVWVGQKFNVSLQAVLPINSRSGHGTGAMIQFHKYLSQ